MQKQINIFIIYAREDKEIKQRLLLHLNPFKNLFNAVIWHDEHIEPGQEWKPHIDSKLEQTDLFLLLISIDFMNSEFINQVEFKHAIDRHKAKKSVAIPLIINYCQWDIDINFKEYMFNLNELQVLPQDAKPIGDWKTPEQAYNNIAIGVRAVLAAIRKKRDEEEKLRETSKKEIEEEQRQNNIKENEKQEKEKQREKDEIKSFVAITEFEKNEAEKQKNQNEKKEAEISIPGQKQEKPDAREKSKPRIIQKKYILITSGMILLAVAAWFVIKMSSSATNPEDTGIQKVPTTNLEQNDTAADRQKKDSLQLQQHLQDSIKEDNAWKTALNRNTIAAFQDYKKNHPDGKHIKEAQHNINILDNQRIAENKNRADDLAWKTAVHANTIESFKNYEMTYPKGNHVTQAQANRQALEDELAWNAAIGENTIVAFQNYEKRYPTGNHFKQAQANIEDDLAWNAAVFVNTITGYKKYQTTYPKGRHFNEASGKIKLLDKPKEILVNKIGNFRAVNISDKELEITVDYTYDGNHGIGLGYIYMAAVAYQSDGTQVPRTHFEGYGGPGEVKKGTGTCKMLIKKFTDGSYTSVTIKVMMMSRQPYGEVLSQRYKYTKYWK